jgi:hypothetical protein
MLQIKNYRESKLTLGTTFVCSFHYALMLILELPTVVLKYKDDFRDNKKQLFF